MMKKDTDEVEEQKFMKEVLSTVRRFQALDPDAANELAGLIYVIARDVISLQKGAK